MRLIKDSVTIASKISRSDKQKLHAIADDLGITFYGLLQSLICTLVRYWDKGSAVTAEHRTMINAFSNVLASVIGSHNPVSLKGSEGDSVKGAILLVERKTGKRPQVIEIRKNEHGTMIESYNYDTMLSTFLGAVDPNALRCLEDEAKELGYFSITQTLHELILQNYSTQKDPIGAEVRELFSDVRICSGIKVNTDIQYKSRRRHNLAEYTTIAQVERYKVE